MAFLPDTMHGAQAYILQCAHRRTSLPEPPPKCASRPMKAFSLPTVTTRKPVVGEIVFMPVSAFETNRGNAVANHTDRVKHTVGPAYQTFPMACHRSVTDGTGSHCNKL